MVKCVANLDFTDKETGLRHAAGTEFEMTIDRANEAQETLRKRAEKDEIHPVYKSFEINRVDEPEPAPKKAAVKKTTKKEPEKADE